MGLWEARFYTDQGIEPAHQTLTRVDLTPTQIPQQTDDYSCGALVCHYILTLLIVLQGYWNPGVTVLYTSSKVKQIRKEIARFMFKYSTPVIDRTPPEPEYPEQYE